MAYPRPRVLHLNKRSVNDMKRKLTEKPWYPTAAAICIGVALYAVLMNLGSVLGGIRTFFGYFSSVLLGCLIAYLVNPLAKLYRRLFSKLGGEKRYSKPANILAFVTVLLFIGLVLLVILPQLIDSIETFVNNLDGYVASLQHLLDKWGLSERLELSTDSFDAAARNIVNKLSKYVRDNLTNIIGKTADTGRALVQLVIGFILSIYLLAEKDSLAAGVRRLAKAILKPAGFEASATFLQRCDAILTRYIVFNLLDSVIIFAANAVFMIVTGMPYMGLVSFVAAITNLVPTFGPVVGGAIGAFVLVLVKPLYALEFLIFTVVLQICDGYVIKPRLFGNSLGVSGLWILIAVIVGGSMFGMIGILVAIPAVAILDFTYRERLLPWLEARRAPKVGAPLSDSSGDDTQ